MPRELPTLAVWLLAGIVVGCTDPVAIDPPDPAAIRAVAGASQNAEVGTVVPEPLVARVLDASGQAIEGVVVHWTAEPGHGTIAPEESETDADGRAMAVWTLGTVAGPQSARATIEGLGAVAFSATARPGPLAQIRIDVDSSRVRLVRGEGLRLGVRAADRFGNEVRVPDELAWRSGDSLTVDVDESGRIRAKRIGQAWVVLSHQAAIDSILIPVQPLVLASISAGVTSTCGLSADGVAYCWGTGRLGLDECIEVVCPRTPGRVNTDVRFRVVNAGYKHFCGIDLEDNAYCWGVGANQVGAGPDLPDRCSFVQCTLTPLPVVGRIKFASVSPGTFHTCGVALDGTGYCWGENGYGELGNATNMDSSVPVRVADDRIWKKIDAGLEETCGLTAAGSTYCWGKAYTKLPITGNDIGVNRPARSGGSATFETITHVNAVCGMTSDGVVSCWGGGPDGSNELCFGDCNFIPHVMDTQARFQSIDAGGVVSCGVSTTEEAYCWGANDKGQRGSGVRDFCTAEGCEQRPLPVFGGLRWRSVSAGGFHACGITVTGKAYCWGSNAEGQLGADPSADMSGCDAECALKPELVFGQE